MSHDIATTRRALQLIASISFETGLKIIDPACVEAALDAAIKETTSLALVSCLRDKLRDARESAARRALREHMRLNPRHDVRRVARASDARSHLRGLRPKKAS